MDKEIMKDRAVQQTHNPKEVRLPQDVTDKVILGCVDSGSAELRQCVCGNTYPDPWSAQLSNLPLDAWECDYCHAKLFFEETIRVFKLP